jgi:hypothetical protein
MQCPPFLDEARSDRSWQLLLVLAATLTMTLVAAFLFVAALTHDADPLLRLLVGGLFGAGFLVLFGWASIVLTRRILSAPVRVRIDDLGVRVGDRSLAWREVRQLQVFSGGLPRRVSLVFQASVARRSLQVPGLFPVAEGAELVQRLGEHFASSNLPVSIEVK